MPANHNLEIAVVGSPSTNIELTIDLLQEATEDRLVGALTAFEATQSGNMIVSVGQIVGIELKNRWHEDSVFRNLVKRTGDIPPITNRQDTRIANFVVGTTFCKKGDSYEPDVLGMVPPTGTRVSRIDQERLNDLLKVYEKEISYLGRAYANDVFYPMWFKHFDQGAGGAGEAYHIGVFGKTGSGKSGLAKMMLAAYSKHPTMGILIIDPQGEFAAEFRNNPQGNQKFPLHDIVKGQKRSIHVFSIADIQLNDWDSFEEMLISLNFLEKLGIPSRSQDNVRIAATTIRNALEDAKFKLSELGIKENDENAKKTLETAFTAIQSRATHVYSSPGRAAQLSSRVDEIRQSESLKDEALRTWKDICGLFSYGKDRQTIHSIVGMLLEQSTNTGQHLGGAIPKPVIVVDLSQQGNAKSKMRFWSEALQRRILSKLLTTLIYQSAGGMPSGKSANVLVLLDEAHRHAPSGKIEDSDAEHLRGLLRRAVRETRKYGLGWFFISQTLGGLDNEILQQLRILSFGFGLAMGSEFDRLRDFVGGDKRSLELYQSFRDPQSFPNRAMQEFPYMVVGPVSPLAFSGKPLFFSAFTDTTEFLQVNRMSMKTGHTRDTNEVDFC